jgi:hypothetical protein
MSVLLRRLRYNNFNTAKYLFFKKVSSHPDTTQKEIDGKTNFYSTNQQIKINSSSSFIKIWLVKRKNGLSDDDGQKEIPTSFIMWV